MKRLWQRLSERIDALSLRERALVFVVCALVVLTIVHTFLLDPLFARQKKLSAELTQQQNQIDGISSEIALKLAQVAVDPDAPSRRRVAELGTQISERQNQLSQMQKGLIAPDRMAGVLETILRRNEHLHLVSLTTLPVTTLDGTPDAAKAAASAPVAPAAPAGSAAATPSTAPAAGGIYRHGVEIVVEGSYPDMQAYLAALEAMPAQLFWGKAELKVAAYPKATLTLTLYTMSLDTKWMNL